MLPPIGSQIPAIKVTGVALTAMLALVLQACSNLQFSDGPPPSTLGSVNAPRTAKIATAATTMTGNDIREALLIGKPARRFNQRRGLPAVSFLTPTAYGADYRDAFIGVSGVTEGNNTDLDGSMGFGFGVGDAIDTLGLEVNVSIISLTDAFADDGSIGFKVHKLFPNAGNLAIGLGFSNVIGWGFAENTADTLYAVVSRQIGDHRPLTASVGVGTGTFRTDDSRRDGNNDLNLFGSLGWQFSRYASAIGSWNGRALGAAISLVPLDAPLVLTLGISDITDETAPGPRFNGTLGYSVRF